MIEYCEELAVQKEIQMPVAIKAAQAVLGAEELLISKPACVSFNNNGTAHFSEKGAYVVLDYGKELCGGVRIVITDTEGTQAHLRITLGESLTEACSHIGEKNATNDHSPRDFEVMVPHMSDLTFGMSGFRFARIELLNDVPFHVSNIFAVSTLPRFEREGYIETDDPVLNQIIDTAAYTLKLNLQNGYIWDGIKRDRLVWSGDLNPEILVASYLYGDIAHISNSLRFLMKQTPPDEWINYIPSYNAWWVINLCDHYRLTGGRALFEECRDYALAVIRNFDRCITDDGEMDFSVAKHYMQYFLDWPTTDTPDAKIGTAALIVYMAKKFLEIEENPDCRALITKLSGYLDMDCTFKQTRAFQILAGRDPNGQAAFLEQGGAEGLSTFMAYYILKADAMAQGQNILPMIKQYYGGMLSRGATTFWEDFDIRWLENSGRIDTFPKPGEKDLHGDYGAFCYEGFRHSLCHGWAAGVLAFVIEEFSQLHGVKCLKSCIHTKDGWQTTEIH